MARVASLIAALGLALLGPVLLAPPASAHATMTASWPANHQVLTSAPDHVLVEFSAEVSPDTLVAIVDPDGKPVDVGEPSVDGRFLSQPISPTGTAGTYVAAFHVIARDLHPIVARMEFTVDPAGSVTANPAGAEPDLTPAPAEPVDQGPDRLGAVVPFVFLVALAAVLALVVRRRSPQH